MGTEAGKEALNHKDIRAALVSVVYYGEKTAK
jgi:hypothetical protein